MLDPCISDNNNNNFLFNKTEFIKISGFFFYYAMIQASDSLLNCSVSSCFSLFVAIKEYLRPSNV